MGQRTNIPAWLLEPSDYEPERDRDGFISQSILSVTSVLAHFRLDDGVSTTWSPSAPAKLLFGFGCILLTSLSGNFIFSLVMLALLLARMAILPAPALKRVVSVSLVAAALTFCLMIPAILLGQNHSAVLIAVKVFVSVGIALTVALTTPFNQLTAALRVFHVPNLVILTFDLALKNIVRLGQTALEVLTALKLRSVGKNTQKGRSMGGIGGVVFLKSNEAANQTWEAMECRGFQGHYVTSQKRQWRAVDVAWFALLAALIVLFVYLQGAM